MDFRGHKNTSFSPYHDDGGLIDFLDDDAQRVTTNAALVFFLHVGLAFALSGSFIVPDLKPPPPPKSVTVEIVTFDPVAPESEPEPVVIEAAPVAPPPAPSPKPRPTPRPQPDPTPLPPPPVVDPEPEPIVTPPPPEILAQPEPELLDPIVAEPLPEPEPELIEPLEPEPIIEFFEPIPEPAPDPISEPEPLLEFFEPEPEIIETPEPELPPLIDNLPPTPGVIEAEPLPDIMEPDPLPPQIVILPDPLPVPRETPPPLPIPEIVPTAPTVLASPEAPETREQARRAVPQEQSDPFMDLLKRDRDSNLSGPTTGGGNESPVGNINMPPGGGTRLGTPNPGTGGWTLSPQPTGPGKAYEGLVLDIRCREAGRTHNDCPEYLRKFRGRAADGSESFNGMAGTGRDRGDRIEGSKSLPSRRSIGLPIGDNSVNAGGPSTGALDFQDTNFDREFLGKTLDLEPDSGRLRDLLTPPEPPTTAPDWTLKPPPETDADDTDWVLEKLPE